MCYYVSDIIIMDATLQRPFTSLWLFNHTNLPSVEIGWYNQIVRTHPRRLSRYIRSTWITSIFEMVSQGDPRSTTTTWLFRRIRWLVWHFWIRCFYFWVRSSKDGRKVRHRKRRLHRNGWKSQPTRYRLYDDWGSESNVLRIAYLMLGSSKSFRLC